MPRPLPRTTNPRSRPLWQNSALRHLPGGLEGNATADIVVIGAGVAGLSTGFLLAREGRSVMVVDDGLIGGGETGRTTAHLSCALEQPYGELERMHGPGGAQLAAASHVAAIDQIEQIVREEEIRCDFGRLDGYLFDPPDVSDSTHLAGEWQAAQRAGLTGVQWSKTVPVPALTTGPALRFPRQAQLHPLKYLAGLAAAFARVGGRLHAPTHVVEVRGGKSVQLVTRSGAIVTCNHVVVATNAPINDRLMLMSKMVARRTYVIAASVPPCAVPTALYWDTMDPCHYVRVSAGRGEDRLIIGGEDHKTGQADDAEQRYARLEAWARARFPDMGPVETRWSGQALHSVDGLGFIGRAPQADGNVFVATGDCGNGLTHGTIAGLLLTDLIQGRSNPWAALYDPARVPPEATAGIAAENVNELAQYADWFTRGETITARIERNEGAVVREGVLKVAAYRDARRNLHRCLAICPHMGGVVRWNHGEMSFDCPVHGSRFDRHGKVINGPASRDLKSLQPSGEETGDVNGKSPDGRAAV